MIVIKDCLRSARCRMCTEGKPADKPCLAVEIGDVFHANLCVAHLFAMTETYFESPKARATEAGEGVPTASYAGNGSGE